jgi:catechol 2,3-dioxygenase-like lactoylglutathione lyase family enzyme
MALSAQAQISRPPITGIAHVGFYVSDQAKADEFYGHVLGYAHWTVDKPDLKFNCYKVSDRQYIKIYPGLKGDEQDRLAHVAFETTDAHAMRDYLASKGVSVPATLQPDLEGNLSFKVIDPEGRHIEFVQYVKGEKPNSAYDAPLSPARISDHIIHAGFIVHDRATEDRFYRDILGFEVMWYGGMTDTEVKWVDMRVPDGTDWLEYMLAVKNPSVRSRGVNNHFALGVEKIQPAYQAVLERGYKPPEPPKIGRDGKWQLNIYDPDQTRVEFMEFKPTQTPCCSPMKMK